MQGRWFAGSSCRRRPRPKPCRARAAEQGPGQSRASLGLLDSPGDPNSSSARTFFAGAVNSWAGQIELAERRQAWGVGAKSEDRARKAGFDRLLSGNARDELDDDAPLRIPDVVERPPTRLAL